MKVLKDDEIKLITGGARNPRGYGYYNNPRWNSYSPNSWAGQWRQAGYDAWQRRWG